MTASMRVRIDGKKKEIADCDRNLELVCPLFWGLNPPKQGPNFKQNKGHLGSRNIIVKRIIVYTPWKFDIAPECNVSHPKRKVIFFRTVKLRGCTSQSYTEVILDIISICRYIAYLDVPGSYIVIISSK